jgi:hypothetical protein
LGRLFLGFIVVRRVKVISAVKGIRLMLLLRVEGGGWVAAGAIGTA